MIDDLTTLARQLGVEARLWSGPRRDLLLQGALAVALAASASTAHDLATQRAYLDAGRDMLARHAAKRGLDERTAG